jgi:Helix-turn-helix family
VCSVALAPVTAESAMPDDPITSLPRRLWQVVEPIHAVVYFADEPADAAKAVGLKGWWMGYFAGRAAPMGAVGAAVVTATFYGFEPSMPARALPDAWALADPQVVLASRLEATSSALRNHLGDGLLGAVADVGDLVAEAADVARADVAGRPLAAAWASVARTGDPVADLWLDTAVLREHRGDGHVSACVASRLGPLEANVLLATTGLTDRALVLRARGWSEEDWDATVAGLHDRGLVTVPVAATTGGAALRREVEAATDQLAAGPTDAVGPPGVERIETALAPLGRHLVDTGLLPTPNPIGLPRPPD